MSDIMKKKCNENEEGAEQRKGPWTLEEDTLLTDYIARNGEGRWNLLAKASGLKRKGKSCRLRWLNYLKPDIKRGNLTPQEQLLILELHCKWGNRWSKIAQYLPGRTDNEIKNYWRTRVQKQARQLNIDSSSHQFLEVVRSFWVPRLTHKMKDSSNTNTKSLPMDSLGPILQDSKFSHDLGFNNIDCSTFVSQDLTKISQFMDLSDLEIPSSMHLEESRGSVIQYVNEDYRSFPCLEDEHIVTTMGNLEILPFQDCQVGVSTYQEDVTQDPMWNMDDIWQFGEYAPLN
ncbi:unnamed protein product [Eruca vesicaria subsp. sativa]|uniref:Uncharacterized protein n=1 Tax=Eruca vesicaria subsp. sativa TaxID=29727 RepID=A0ABC8KM22_ERUVS|nr:unnamed protein product [Eruca vesicaria subsp. sativa]